jgi:hypothetical protein
MQQVVRIFFLPHIGIAPLPVDGTHGTALRVVDVEKAVAEGRVPDEGVQEQFVAAQ